MLDVGCATGYFLEVAQRGGFDPYGVEFSEYAAGIAKEKFGKEKIFHGTLEQFHDATGRSGAATFRAIAMSDLIEHVRIPSETLTAATINAAWSLNLAAETGSLEPGKSADFVVHEASDYREIPYKPNYEGSPEYMMGLRKDRHVLPLFAPFKIGQIALKNRVVMAPMTRTRTFDGDGLMS